MDQINKIRYNGKDYALASYSDETVQERSLGDGSTDIIFIGLMDETDVDKPITYSYLTGLLEKDSANNKVFEPTTLPITVRTKYESNVAKAFFMLVPKEHPNLYSLTTGCQCFTGWGDGEDVTIDFPFANKPYKLFRFSYFNYRCDNPLTYTF